jgi:hypothetical protein
VGESNGLPAASRFSMRDAGSVAKATIASIVLLAVFFAWLGSTEARAADTAVRAYVYSHTFANQGQISTAPGANQIAVEPGSGNLIVDNAGLGHIDIVNPDAEPSDPSLASFGEGTWASIAVDPDSGDVYAASFFGGEIVRFVPGALPLTYELDPTFNVEGTYRAGTTVDPSTGDLLAIGGGREREIVRFGHSGEVISSFEPHSPQFSPNGIAVGSNGDIFIGESFQVGRYGPSGAFLGTISLVRPGEAQTFSTKFRSIAFDAARSAFDIVTQTAPTGANLLRGYSETGEQIFTSPLPESLNGTASMGLAADPQTTGLYSLVAGEPGAIQAFDTAIYPGVTKPAVSAISSVGAHVSATVDAGEGPPAGSFAKFEYKPVSGPTWLQTPEQAGASGSIEADLEGLEPNLEYLVRAVAANETFSNFSDTVSFATAPIPPVVVTSNATEIGEDRATLAGSVNPVGEQTRFYFEYGATTSYGNRAPAAVDGVAGNGRAPRAVSRTIEGLQPSTTYHYRLVAVSGAGASYGADVSLTTTPAQSLITRAYEQVTPVDKGGSTIDTSLGFGGATNSGLSYVVLSPEGQSSPLYGRGFSTRGPTSWIYGGTADPPITADPNFVFVTTLGMSADLSKAFVVSNRQLTQGGVKNGTNLYISDLRTGAYTLVGSTEDPRAFETFATIQAYNKFIYGNADFTTVIFASRVPLLPGVSGSAIYRWSETAGLQLESTVAGGGLPASSAGVEPRFFGYLRSVSDDSSRDYYVLSGPNRGEAGESVGVYLRENGRARPISVSRRPGDPDTPVFGEFLGTGRDGRYAYFASSVPLTDDGAEGEGGIYRYDAANNELMYIGASVGSFGTQLAPLGVSDDGLTFYFLDDSGNIDVLKGDVLRHVPGLNPGQIGQANLTPDGRYLTFSYEAEPGRQQPISVYDYATGETSCASCLPDGVDPGGASFPESDHIAGNETPRNIDSQGDVFFQTTSALLPSDTNGLSDVYEYNHDGALRLVSPGSAAFPAHFAEVSADGRDVYFTTAQGLVGQDTDRATDIYDARIGGGLPSQNPNPERQCVGEGCSAVSAGPPGLTASGSETTAGRAPSKQTKKKKTKKKKHKAQCHKAVAKKAHVRCSPKHPRHGQSSQKGRKS